MCMFDCLVLLMDCPALLVRMEFENILTSFLNYYCNLPISVEYSGQSPWLILTVSVLQVVYIDSGVLCSIELLF